MLKTINIYPPIPWRKFDWCAYEESELCCDECGLVQGFGETELDAIFDWLDQKRGNNEI